MTPCNGCPNFDWCKQRGCITWNDHSRVTYFELKRRAKESNDWIDAYERDFLSPPATVEGGE